jgi:hypothetical protein
MPKSLFDSFHAALPPSVERVPFDPQRHGALASKVPADLAAEWRNFGFGAYGSGLIWTCVPDDEPFLDPDDWSRLDGTGIEVLRTAFADVCLWQKDQFLLLSVHSGKVFEFGSNAELLFGSLIHEQFRKNYLRERLFGVARQRLGDLGPEDCYGFAPLPALGGAIAEEYLIKSPMREYVAMAAQVLG